MASEQTPRQFVRPWILRGTLAGFAALALVTVALLQTNSTDPAPADHAFTHEPPPLPPPRPPEHRLLEPSPQLLPPRASARDFAPRPRRADDEGGLPDDLRRMLETLEAYHRPDAVRMDDVRRVLGEEEARKLQALNATLKATVKQSIAADEGEGTPVEDERIFDLLRRLVGVRFQILEAEARAGDEEGL